METVRGGMVQLGLAVVEGWGFLLGFFYFEITFFPPLSLDLGQPLLQLIFAVTENQKQIKTNDTGTIIPINRWNINRHRSVTT